MILHCMGVLIYLIYSRPFGKPLLNMIEIFNEFCILVAAYHLFAFTDYLDDVRIKYNGGWSLIVITIINIIVNLFIMLR
jgi:hypothetical protein